MAEQYQNDPADTTLDEDLDGSETTVTVADGSAFPAAGNYRIRVDDEIMLVTARSTNDLTVTRGAEGTSAASHTTGAAVTLLLTRGSLLKLLEEGVQIGARASRPSSPYAGTLYIPTDYGLMARYSGSAWEHVLDGRKVTPPAVADFTWVNQGGATADDRDGVFLQAPATPSGDRIRALVKSTPGSEYTYTVAMRFLGRSANFIGGGICARESSSGKLLTVLKINVNETIQADTWSSETAYNAVVSSSDNNFRGPAAPTVWLRIVRTATTRRTYTSVNGYDWMLLSDTAQNAYLSEDQVGLCIFTNRLSVVTDMSVQAYFPHLDLS